MINNLIEKYKNLYEKSFSKYSYYLTQDPDIVLGITEHYRYESNRYMEFINDLEKLKEDIKKINISSINAPTDAMMIFLKNEIIYKEEELFKCASI